MKDLGVNPWSFRGFNVRRSYSINRLETIVRAQEIHDHNGSRRYQYPTRYGRKSWAALKSCHTLSMTGRDRKLRRQPKGATTPELDRC